MEGRFDGKMEPAVGRLPVSLAEDDRCCWMTGAEGNDVVNETKECVAETIGREFCIERAVIDRRDAGDRVRLVVGNADLWDDGAELVDGRLVGKAVWGNDRAWELGNCCPGEDESVAVGDVCR